MTQTNHPLRLYLLIGLSVLTIGTIYIQLYDLDIGLFLSLMVTISALIAMTAFTEYQSLTLWDLIHRGNALSTHLSEQITEQQTLIIKQQEMITELRSQIK